MLVTAGLGVDVGALALRGMGRIAAQADETPNYAARRYYQLLHKRRRERYEREQAEFERSELEHRKELARVVYEAVRKDKPALARQIVSPHIVAAPQGARFEIDWGALANNLVTYECLCRVRAEIEDEDAILFLMMASK